MQIQGPGDIVDSLDLQILLLAVHVAGLYWADWRLLYLCLMNDFCLAGGDHTVSIGTFIATRQQNSKTRLVWIDAHPDINTPCSSLSGNCHGMPVAHLFNYVDGFKTEHPLQPHEILYIGLRSIDQAEQERLDVLKMNGACIYTAEDVKTLGIHAILREVEKSWIEHMDSSTGKFDFPIHVSLDVDSMDPEFTPATGTPVPDGIMPSDVEVVLRWSNRKAAGGLSHLDIVEINCYLSSPSGAAKTVSTSFQLLQAWTSSHQYLSSGHANVSQLVESKSKRVRVDDEEVHQLPTVASTGSVNTCT